MTEGALAVLGTASGVGKSRLVAGLCRLLARRGVRVAPFKAQNMSLNSVATASGHEIARSQAHQALAARIEATVEMNPVLLKPEGDRTSQLILRGRPAGRVRAGERWPSWESVGEVVLSSLAELRRRVDVVLVEGAGGAAEINLLDHDLANLPLAARAGLPAVLVGDIERGGVFAALYGTVALVPDDLRGTLRGFVINKFHGDTRLLAPGISELERRCNLPCFGVLPHLGPLGLDEEDALTLAVDRRAGPAPAGAAEVIVDIAVVALPHLSNFTDFEPLALEPGVTLRYVRDGAALHGADLVVLPGSKATVTDLAWLRASGMADALARAHRRGAALLGICAGYQMLGTEICDEVESGAGTVPGLGVVSAHTEFSTEKTVRQRTMRSAGGETVTGYELHHGTVSSGGEPPWFHDEDGRSEGIANERRAVFATSLHGLFEQDAFRSAFLGALAHRRGARRPPARISYAAARNAQIDRVADALAEHLDVALLFALAETASPPGTARPRC